MNQKEFERVKQVINQVTSIVNGRFTLNMRYSNYCNTCTPSEFKEFLDTLGEEYAWVYTSAQSATAEFFASARSYLEILTNLKKTILPRLETCKTDVEFEELLCAIGILLFQQNMFYTVYYKQALEIRRQSFNATITSKAVFYKYVPYLLPEYLIAEKINSLLKSIATPSAMYVMEMFQSTDDMAKLIQSHARLLKNVRSLCQFMYTSVRSFRETYQASTVQFNEQHWEKTLKLGKLLSNEEMEASTDFKLGSLTDFKDVSHSLAKRYPSIYWAHRKHELAIELCSELKLQINAVKKEISLVEIKQPYVEALQSQAQILEHAEAQQKQILQQKSEQDELEKLKEIAQLNAAAKAQREALREIKLEMYRAVLEAQAAEAINEQQEEEEENEGSALNFHELNKSNYQILEAIFNPVHLKITFQQIVQLVKAVGGKVTNCGGSGVKITLNSVDSYTFQPNGKTAVSGFHRSHGAGHNNKTLIRPIIKDIQTALKDAGFTPETCTIRNDKSKLGLVIS